MDLDRKLQIVYRKVEDLIPYERNSRTHSEEQIEKVVASIKEFGWTNPILIDEEQDIIAGHGRLEGALLLSVLGTSGDFRDCGRETPIFLYI